MGSPSGRKDVPDCVKKSGRGAKESAKKARIGPEKTTDRQATAGGLKNG